MTSIENINEYSSFPFHNLTDNDFSTLNFDHYTNDYDMDRLSHMKINPFQINSKVALSRNNKDLDSLFDINNIDCDYFLPTELKSKLSYSKQKLQFSLLHLNKRSIYNKFDAFKHLLDSLDMQFQIIGLTETWLNNSNCDTFQLKEYNYVGSNRTSKRGGGVGMYISKNIKYQIRKDLTENNIDDSIETIFIQVSKENEKNLVIGVIYRPPNNKTELFENAMNQIFNVTMSNAMHNYVLYKESFVREFALVQLRARVRT